jgi:chromatin remodeling complex protein RSC6
MKHPAPGAKTYPAANISLTSKFKSSYTPRRNFPKPAKIKKRRHDTMKEKKGLDKPVKLKADLAALLGAKELPRTEITKKLWDYIKKNKLQTRTVNGKPENAGKNIVVDAKLIKIVNNTKVKTSSGKVVDLTKIKEGQTIDMMQIASVVNANIE